MSCYHNRYRLLHKNKGDTCKCIICRHLPYHKQLLSLLYNTINKSISNSFLC